MKKFAIYVSLSVLCAIAIYAAGANHVNRFGYQSILATGGSSTTNAKTVLVTEDSGGTNEYSFALVTAAVTGAQTASTNTFSSAYVANPTVVKGMISGASGTITTNALFAPLTVTTSTVIVTGMSTNLVTGVNNLPLIIYGYKRTGVFE